MKKKLLSLALALVLCLSLTVSPMAKEVPGPFSSEHISISNVVSYEDDWDGGGPGMPMTCKAPVEIVTLKNLMGFSGILAENWGDDDPPELEIAGKEEITAAPHPEKQIKAGAKIMLTEPGQYVIDTYLCTDSHDSHNGGGGEYESFYITVVADDGGAASDPGSTPAPTETPAAPKFTDVDSASPFAAAIDWAVDQGITNGITLTTFGPGNTCTVSHILTFLWRANGKPGAAEGVADRDSAAAWAVEQGMIPSASPDEFNVNAACSRGAAVTFMWIAAGKPEVTSEKKFTDVPEENTELVNAIAWAFENGVTTGTGDGSTFSSANTCTRGQIVTFLYRASK